MKFIFSLLFLIGSFTVFSQSDNIKRCDHDAWLDEIEKTNPGYKQKIKDSFKSFNQGKKSDKRWVNITIPVHVIIVHPTGQAIGTGSNHSLAHVQSQIDVLNQDFGRYNSDAGNTPPEFPAADTGIQFCLATVDPDGNPTDGITRYAFDGAFHPNSSTIRQETRWPRETYSNIWSAPNLPYLGLASLPSTFALPPPNSDFIHVDAATFGGPGFATFPNYNLGRTTTHEMGHYLGLDHIWGGNGCGNDDGIGDTPVQDNENFGCPNHPSPSCGNGGDMFMNYMDYVNDNCMNAFSQEQGDYMNTILSTSRASLNGASFTACATSVPLVLNVISQGDPNCADSDDGFILAEASGGNPDYSYSLNGEVATSNNLFTDLPGGNYTIEAFDADGNSANATTFLNTPLPLTATVDITQTNTCPNEMNGVVEIQVAGGSNPYTYALDMGTPQQSNEFDGLSNGFYVINVVDNNGCSFEDVFELEDSTEIMITIDSTSNLDCYNDNMGLIIASAEGGNGPLSYSINGSDYQDAGAFSELDGGLYYVYVKDSIGCFDSLEVILSEPDSFYLSIETNDATCFDFNDGSVTVDAIGGNGTPFQYSLDSMTFEDTVMLDNLVAGEYDLYVLDSLGCPASASFEIGEPDEIQIWTDTIINVACFGENSGMASLFATGGNGEYTFIFQGDTTATGDFDNLEVGMYELYVIDSNGCEDNTTFEIGSNSTIMINVINNVAPSCFGNSNGSVEVSTSNTQGFVMYSINGGAMQESPLFTELPAGDHLIVVQDESGCDAAINVVLGEPNILSMQIVSTINVTCNGGDDGGVEIAVSGGTPPYQYSYEDMGVDPLGLTAGTYLVTVTDGNGCTESSEFTILEPEPLELSIITQEGADCESGIGALLELEALGGTESYNYVLTGSSGMLTNDDGVFNELQYGPHQASVTDGNGCTTVMDVDITLENMFYAEIISVTDILCFSDLGGALNLDVKGGMGNITYLLDAAIEIDPSMLDTHAGDHTISIVDENECMIELFFSLEEPEELVVDQIVIDGQNNATVFASGGIEPYMYSFDGGEIYTDSNMTEYMGTGMVAVKVKDANGCEVEDILFILGVDDVAQDWGVNAYPNPFQEELNLKLDFPTNIDATIEVFDIEGRKVHNILTKKYNTGENFVKIDLSNFASSIYIVKIASAEGYRYIKATKM